MTKKTTKKQTAQRKLVATIMEAFEKFSATGNGCSFNIENGIREKVKSNGIVEKELDGSVKITIETETDPEPMGGQNAGIPTD